jgi:hypothetical protein
MALIGTLGVWCFYIAGQFLHLLLGAHLALASKLNSVTTYSEYLRIRWVPILCRLFLTTAAFVIVWGNPAILELTRFMPTVATQIAMAGILGWFSDSVFDKLLGMIPIMQKELPMIDSPPQP